MLVTYAWAGTRLSWPICPAVRPHIDHQPESAQMARKVLNRKELRDENDAAEREAKTTKKKPVKAEGDEAKKKVPVKRKSRAKTAKEVRLKAFWGVFNQSMKRVALFDYSQKKQADKKAVELSTSAKSPHFVQPVKEVIEE
jgi:hypothetical protein